MYDGLGKLIRFFIVGFYVSTAIAVVALLALLLMWIF